MSADQRALAREFLSDPALAWLPRSMSRREALRRIDAECVAMRREFDALPRGARREQLRFMVNLRLSCRGVLFCPGPPAGCPAPCCAAWEMPPAPCAPI